MRGAPLASRRLQTFARLRRRPLACRARFATCFLAGLGFRGELVAVRLVRKLVVGLVRMIRLDDLHVGRLQLVEILLNLR